MPAVPPSRFPVIVVNDIVVVVVDAVTVDATCHQLRYAKTCVLCFTVWTLSGETGVSRCNVQRLPWQQAESVNVKNIIRAGAN